jgi:DNA-binding beta-propeller fold protein YncE
LRKASARKVIANGAPATQMPPFAATLSENDIASLVEHIYTPLVQAPHWGEKEIAASHVVHRADLVHGDARSSKPVYPADPLNVFLVVEAGDHHVTVLDGDRFEPLHRFKSRHALHGGPKYTSDGRFVYLASRDGWISKFDMHNLVTVAEVRAGINTRNAAVSSDDRYVLVGNYLPHTLVLLDARDLSLIRIIPVVDELDTTSRVSAVYDAGPRQSFIVALKDLKELWEIPYMDDPPSYGNRDEGQPEQVGKFPVRRIQLDDFLDDFFFDQDYQHVLGAARNQKNGQVVNLIVGRKIADMELSGLPHLGSGISWQHGDKTVFATPNLKEPVISIIDMQSWKTLKKIDTLGPGFFMRSHENSRYAWVDVFFGPHRDAVHVIDKQTLEIVETLRPAKGKTAAHVEFTRDGKYALLSVWDTDGAVVVYDGDTLEEVKRIAMNKPVGKYNVYNKITRSAGTSH